MKIQDRQNGPSKLFRAYQKKLAGYAPATDHVVMPKMVKSAKLKLIKI